MAAIEYQPVSDLETSRKKLREIVDAQVEIPDQTLFECVQDVLASRGGERWKKLDEIWLTTRNGIRLAIGFDEPIPEEPWEKTWIGFYLPDVKSSEYQLRKWQEGDGIIYELEQVDPESGESSAVNNIFNNGLAGARLLSILADAHEFSPLEVFEDAAYSP